MMLVDCLVNKHTHSSPSVVVINLVQINQLIPTHHLSDHG